MKEEPAVIQRPAVGTAFIAVVAIIVIVGTIGVILLTSQSNMTTSSNSPSPPIFPPAPFIGGLSAQNVSCSLASGVCAFTIVNNSTTPLELEDCQMTVIASVNLTTTTTYTASSEQTTTTYITFGNGSISTVVSTPSSSIALASTVTQTATAVSNFNGTMGGPATVGIPANSQTTATCTIPTTQLGHETVGSIAEGGLQMKLIDSYDSYPAGTEIRFGFEGTWSH